VGHPGPSHATNPESRRTLPEPTQVERVVFRVRLGNPRRPSDRSDPAAFPEETDRVARVEAPSCFSRAPSDWRSKEVSLTQVQSKAGFGECRVLQCTRNEGWRLALAFDRRRRASHPGFGPQGPRSPSPACSSRRFGWRRVCETMRRPGGSPVLPKSVLHSTDPDLGLNDFPFTTPTYLLVISPAISLL